jgi:hypothetical protein
MKKLRKILKNLKKRANSRSGRDFAQKLRTKGLAVFRYHAGRRPWPEYQQKTGFGPIFRPI